MGETWKLGPLRMTLQDKAKVKTRDRWEGEQHLGPVNQYNRISGKTRRRERNWEGEQRLGPVKQGSEISHEPRRMGRDRRTGNSVWASVKQCSEISHKTRRGQEK